MLKTSNHGDYYQHILCVLFDFAKTIARPIGLSIRFKQVGEQDAKKNLRTLKGFIFNAVDQLLVLDLPIMAFLTQCCHQLNFRHMNSDVSFFHKLRQHAFEPALVKRAIIISLVVGTILVVINHGAIIYKGQACWFTLLQILLNLAVPYTVSTVSSVLAISDKAD